jgi:hypothetical protein
MLDTQSGYSLSRIFLKIFAIISLVVLSVPSAQAVPSYSRQTGLPCASCHYAPPELTPFGRTFKLEGYTFTTKAQVSDDKKDHNAALHLLEAFPLSIIFDASFTATTCRGGPNRTSILRCNTRATSDSMARRQTTTARDGMHPQTTRFICWLDLFSKPSQCYRLLA